MKTRAAVGHLLAYGALACAGSISTSTSHLASRPASGKADPTTRASIAGICAGLPLAFEANQGQSDGAVKFISRGNGYALFLTSTEAVLRLNRGSSEESAPAAGDHPRPHRVKPPAGELVRLKAVGANPSPKVTGLDKLPGKSNYFVGNDPAKWRRDVAHYAKVKIESIYPGIDLVYYGNRRRLEYDWIVNRGADPKAIRFAVDGKDDLKIDGRGDLVLDARGNLRLNKPSIYQERAGTRTEVPGSYALLGEGELGFELGQYDTSLPLVIDPVLSYSTYLGGSSDERGRAIAVDPYGGVYVTGETGSADFPLAQPFQSVGGSNGDGFVTKISIDNVLIYSTFLGGSGTDVASGIAVDVYGNAYVTGRTQSDNFPTKNPLNLGGADSDAFVTKLNAAGNDLVYSTYLGGDSIDEGRAIAVDGSGNAYVTGLTASTNFPKTNPLQASHSGGTWDAFVTKVNDSGSAPVYSTYLGGNGSDVGSGIAADSSGNAYVTGHTSSSNFPTTGPFQPTLSGTTDGFVTKLNASGNARFYSTYLGGDGADIAQAVAVDPLGNAYIAGHTSSGNFPTLGPAQANHSGGTYDGFVTKLNTSGGGLVYSTYLGGSGLEWGFGLAVDLAGMAYFTGMTRSVDFPTANPIQANHGGGTEDAFVTKLNANGSVLVYSTYLGGAGVDEANGIAVDCSGNAYIAGYTSSSNFPTTRPRQASLNGDSDIIVAKVGYPPVGSTVAYWRFEEGPDGAAMPHFGYPDGVFVPGAMDSSGNGNGLSAWAVGPAGFNFRMNTASPRVRQTGAVNTFSVQNTGAYPAMNTGSLLMRAITPSAFTIEVSFKPETGGYRTLVGRDSRGASTANPDYSALYLQIIPGDAVAIKFGDLSGYWHEAISAPGLITGFPYPQTSLGHWYHMAAVSDGHLLSLYLSSGAGYKLVAQTDLSLSGSPSTALTEGKGSGADWTAGNWSVGRGLYAGAHTDRAYGFIDEVRISWVALNPSQFLFAANPSLDFDADGNTDIAVRRLDNSAWYALPSGSPGTFTDTRWGVSSDIPVIADYDGDGKVDIAVWRPSSGIWYTLPTTQPGTYSATQWGVSSDIPIPGDYDGDGRDDIAVWNPGKGIWYVLPSASWPSYTSTQWGSSGDVAVPGDYDGDGTTDIAVWRPSSGIWYVRPSGAPGSFTSTQWGSPGDKPVPADYDGDAKVDIAIWRPSSGFWYILLSSKAPGTYIGTPWGVSTDIPAAGNFDGDGKVDIAVWRPSSGTWYALRSSSAGTYIERRWGQSTDVPISALTAILRQVP